MRCISAGKNSKSYDTHPCDGKMRRQNSLSRTLDIFFRALKCVQTSMRFYFTRFGTFCVKSRGVYVSKGYNNDFFKE